MDNTINNKKPNIQLFIYIGIILLLIIGIRAVLFLLQGKTTITKGEEDIESIQSLACNGENIDYQFFKNDDATKKSLEIDAIFNNDKLREISFVYALTYDDNKQAVESEAINHAAMGISFGEDSLEVDAFNSDFSIIDNIMQMSLYAKANEIGATESKYFLLEDANGVYNIDNLSKIYTDKGLKCKTKQ